MVRTHIVKRIYILNTQQDELQFCPLYSLSPLGRQGPTKPYLVEVGRYNDIDVNDNYQPFSATQYLPDALYSLTAQFSRDFMILVLNGTSTKTPIALNRQGTAIPVANQSLTVIGLGYTIPNVRIFPPILQQVNVNAIPNNICEQASDNNGTTYQGLITPDMLCAESPNKDACNGDSGGPLMLLGNNPSSDTLVGLVSWYVPHQGYYL